ncbi:hypothetical protein BC629DRAFT_1435281 [Irpex lacteus]|nr:hypothetical protein BC629DRAFT_1435281 [Irpex lacteus]
MIAQQDYGTPSRMTHIQFRSHTSRSPSSGSSGSDQDVGHRSSVLFRYMMHVICLTILPDVAAIKLLVKTNVIAATTKPRRRWRIQLNFIIVPLFLYTVLHVLTAEVIDGEIPHKEIVSAKPINVLGVHGHIPLLYWIASIFGVLARPPGEVTTGSFDPVENGISGVVYESHWSSSFWRLSDVVRATHTIVIDDHDILARRTSARSYCHWQLDHALDSKQTRCYLI